MNILSVTSLADQFNNNEGKGIDTKRNKSLFYWDHNRYHRTINHPPSNLPELPINEGFTFAGLYSRAVRMVARTDKQHCHCHLSHHIPDDSQEIKPPLNLSSDMIHVGKILLYTKDGHTTYVKVEKIFVDDDKVLCLKV